MATVAMSEAILVVVLVLVVVVVADVIVVVVVQRSVGQSLASETHLAGIGHETQRAREKLEIDYNRRTELVFHSASLSYLNAQRRLISPSQTITIAPSPHLVATNPNEQTILQYVYSLPRHPPRMPRVFLYRSGRRIPRCLVPSGILRSGRPRWRVVCRVAEPGYGRRICHPFCSCGHVLLLGVMIIAYCRKER